MVGKIWEDKMEYENFTYFVGDPLLITQFPHPAATAAQHHDTLQ